MQITELAKGSFVEDANIPALLEATDSVGKEFGFARETGKISIYDFIDGKLIDPQIYAFIKPYEEIVKDMYINLGRYGKVYYQNVPEIGLTGGPRNCALRAKELGLDNIDFTDKVVLDVGCAGGYFTRYAIDRGAGKAIGIDLKEPIEAARHLANYLGYFNNDYEVVNIKEQDYSSEGKDIIFFLSMNMHVGIPHYVLEAPFVVFEDNGEETRKLDQLGEPWTSHFKDIKFIGRNTEHGMKPIYHLSK
jgi:SAM-dependent methyltransferase